MITITDKSKCSGCSACYSICPKEAIIMKDDNEGFLYPEVDNGKCVDCGLCDKVCPVNAPAKTNERITKKYVVQNLDDSERIHSTAGGFFSVVARFVIEDLNGVVFGVGFNDKNEIIHKKATTIEELSDMRGSKYVQSNLGSTFNQIKELLHKGRTVLFVGTPCQVNAVEKLINSENLRKNLITIDLMCMAVSSPRIYSDWIKFLENKYHSKVKKVAFRDKSYGYSTANVRIQFESGKILEQHKDAKSMCKLMFSGYNMRPACYECAFRCIDRAGDFTIGDFHSIDKVEPSMDDDKGTTCLWVHSQKANQIMAEIQESLKIKLLDEKCSSCLSKTLRIKSIPEDRKDFFIDAETLSYEDLTKKWIKNSFKSVLSNNLRPIINKLPIRKVVFRTIQIINQKRFYKKMNQANKK